jgi:hypothetical protein
MSGKRMRRIIRVGFKWVWGLGFGVWGLGFGVWGRFKDRDFFDLFQLIGSLKFMADY